MRFLLPILVGATMVTAASAVGSKAEAATTPGIGTLPLQTKTIRLLKRLAIGGATIAVGITAMVATLNTAMATDARIMATPRGHTVIAAMAGDQVLP